MNEVKVAHMDTVADAEHARRELEERGKEIDYFRAALDPAFTETASLEELFQHTVDLIPLAFGEPEAVCARAKISERSFLSKNFREAAWVLDRSILVQGQTIGTVEVHCREGASPTGDGTFSEGKRRFLEIVAARLGELVRRGLAEDAQLGQSEALREHIRLIERQQEAIRLLSVPVLEIWDKVLMLPVAGTMDSARVADLTDKVLSAVSSKRAQFVIIDITGVQVMDTQLAHYLLVLAQSVRLLGALYILTGVQPDVAMTMSQLGVDVSNVTICASAQDGLQECLRQMGRARVARMLLASILGM